MTALAVTKLKAAFISSFNNLAALIAIPASAAALPVHATAVAVQATDLQIVSLGQYSRDVAEQNNTFINQRHNHKRHILYQQQRRFSQVASVSGDIPQSITDKKPDEFHSESNVSALSSTQQHTSDQSKPEESDRLQDEQDAELLQHIEGSLPPNVIVNSNRLRRINLTSEQLAKMQQLEYQTKVLNDPAELRKMTKAERIDLKRSTAYLRTALAHLLHNPKSALTTFTLEEEITFLEHLLVGMQPGASRLIWKPLGKKLGRTTLVLGNYFQSTIKPMLALDRFNQEKAALAAGSPKPTLPMRDLISRRLLVLKEILRRVGSQESQTRSVVVDTSQYVPNVTIQTAGKSSTSLPPIRIVRRRGRLVMQPIRIPWSFEEDEQLRKLVATFGLSMSQIAFDPIMMKRSRGSILTRYYRLSRDFHEQNMASHSWTPEEDSLILRAYRDSQSPGRTTRLQQQFMKHRSPDSIRQRARELLLNRSTMTEYEKLKVSRGVAAYGRDYFAIHALRDFPRRDNLELLIRWVAVEPVDQVNAIWTADDDAKLVEAVLKVEPDEAFFFDEIRRLFFPTRYAMEIASRWQTVQARRTHSVRERPCTEEEDKRILELYQDLYFDGSQFKRRTAIRKIAVILGRRESSVESRLNSLTNQTHLHRAFTEDDDRIMAETIAECTDTLGFIDWGLVAERTERTLTLCKRRWSEIERQRAKEAAAAATTTGTAGATTAATTAAAAATDTPITL